VCCNSTAAVELLKTDFRNVPMNFAIELAHHPIFNSDARKTPSPAGKATLRIGMFGIPSSAKGSELVVNACAQLSRAGKDVVLVMAGFGVEKFALEAKASYPSLRLEYSPQTTDKELLDLMDTVHVAVQLRVKNLGESSGVVASLIAKNVPTIVSDVGAFKDYAQCCTLIPVDASVQTITNAIQSVSAHYDKEQALRFIETKSAAMLNALWFRA
jgi:glycosyltransferase involved in cell wall biosynthesis